MMRTSLTNVVEVHVYANNFFGLTADGQVYAWGEGFGGLLANSNGSLIGDVLRGAPVLAPTVVPGLGPVRQIVFTGWTAFALQADGKVMAWGDDRDGLLGRGPKQRTTRPAATGLIDIAELAASEFQGVRALRADGGVLAWGKLLDGPTNKPLATPAAVTPSERVRHIAGFDSGMNVLFNSGRVGIEVTDSQDTSQRFR